MPFLLTCRTPDRTPVLLRCIRGLLAETIPPLTHLYGQPQPPGGEGRVRRQNLRGSERFTRIVMQRTVALQGRNQRHRRENAQKPARPDNPRAETDQLVAVCEEPSSLVCLFAADPESSPIWTILQPLRVVPSLFSPSPFPAIESEGGINNQGAKKQSWNLRFAVKNRRRLTLSQACDIVVT